MIFNIGSINIDYIYRVSHLVTPGETIASQQLQTVLGGKGANQSVALARAGATVCHVGRVSENDRWATAEMESAGVDTRYVVSSPEPSGHAIIQVDDGGENAIVLFGGANQQISSEQLQSALGSASSNDWVLVQNECNGLPEVFALAEARGIPVVFNPAPMTRFVETLPLNATHCLVLNEVEAAAVVGLPPGTEVDAVVVALRERFPDTLVALTLGAAGVKLLHLGEVVPITSPNVNAVDTTGAGDTFVGYFMAGLVSGATPVDAATMACAAAALSVTVAGATPSIPLRDVVVDFMHKS